jgi:formylglycine-generating enzyme required for sulfatase activity
LKLSATPRTKPDGGALWEAGADGRYALPRYDADGNPVLADAPVMGVSFFDAQAYCAWRSAETGIAYRLPSEDEWEKAARGVDGRFFPWGNGFDSTFCKMATSRPGRPQPEPVRSYPVDRSVYGVFDCAGGIREWCNDFYDDAKETRSLRGGAWYFNPSFCRVAFRHGYLPHIVFTNFGFRLAKSA